jgi:hypothetical protein
MDLTVRNKVNSTKAILEQEIGKHPNFSGEQHLCRLIGSELKVSCEYSIFAFDIFTWGGK